jgi:hypothetical protein
MCITNRTGKITSRPRIAQDIKPVSPCGLLCSLCSNFGSACAGCAREGGDEACYQRQCCRERGLEACWHCGEFPCGKGYFSDGEWRGIVLALAHGHKEWGSETLTEAVRRKLGSTVDYEEFLGINELSIFCYLMKAIKAV